MQYRAISAAVTLLVGTACGQPALSTDAGPGGDPVGTGDGGPSAEADAGQVCALRAGETCEPGAQACCVGHLECIPHHERHVCADRLAEGATCRPFDFDLCDAAAGLACTEDPEHEPIGSWEEELEDDDGACASTTAWSGARYGHIGPGDPSYHAPLGHPGWTYCRPDEDRYYYDAWRITNVGTESIRATVWMDRRIEGLLLIEYGSFDTADPTDEDGFCDVLEPDRDEHAALWLPPGETRTVVVTDDTDVTQGRWSLDGARRYKIYFGAEGPVEVVPHVDG